ncbi:GNAT family N-acetyltransferase [Pontibacter sp. SGAir0037]|uniref:GNAT family N-acetyltransferase n=1 Tax=Pontibacter sp. SGAir0037 TaxID=2571030 RepID=UPI0010CD4092|nr:GNAT family protein [Pontibacter sp. SGAir0037]QCR21061.1 GNAT family N-acetyltransferase [Pontibacter sp. SGAir0037]
MYFTETIQLEDQRVLLRPFQLNDLEQLKAMALDEEIWRYMPGKISSEAELQKWGEQNVSDRVECRRYAFVIIDKATGALAGSTSYGNISPADKRLEIGWTWLGKDYRGSGLNKHCKFLLLHYAFEVLEYERVELKTDVLNMRSRKAMLKLGATEEGTLRSHTQMHDGRRRDTIYYSILRPEWEEIKGRVFTGFTVSSFSQDVV